MEIFLADHDGDGSRFLETLDIFESRAEEVKAVDREDILASSRTRRLVDQQAAFSYSAAQQQSVGVEISGGVEHRPLKIYC